MKATKWRLYRSEDYPAVKAIHEKQVARYGLAAVGDFPDLLKSPVLMTLVAERDGVIVSAAYSEAVPEWCCVGTDAKASASLRRIAPQLTGWMKKRGFRLSRIVVPQVIAETLKPQLNRAGFKEQNAMYETFLLDLR